MQGKLWEYKGLDSSGSLLSHSSSVEDSSSSASNGLDKTKVRAFLGESEIGLKRDGDLEKRGGREVKKEENFEGGKSFEEDMKTLGFVNLEEDILDMS